MKKTIPLLLVLALVAALVPVSAVQPVEPRENYLSFKDAAALRAYLQWHPNRKPLISAHRGGPMKGFPENAVETFENVLRYGPCIIECDVRLTKDKQLVMMHDDDLERTTNGSGKVAEHTLTELKQLFLKTNGGTMTPYRIPTFGQVLRWAVGRAVLSVDVKRNVPYELVVSRVRKHKAQGHAIIIVYTFDNLKKVHKIAPELMVSASAGSVENARKLLACGVPASNLCAFVGVSEPGAGVYSLLHGKKIYAVLGSMGNLDNRALKRGTQVYRKLYRGGADIISSDNVPLLARAIGEMKKNER